jgi:hypothetical protein
MINKLCPESTILIPSSLNLPTLPPRTNTLSLKHSSRLFRTNTLLARTPSSYEYPPQALENDIVESERFKHGIASKQHVYDLS